MGINLDDPLVQIKVTQSVCGFIAACMTVWRLYLRRSRYWWDDAWAFFSLLTLLIQFASVFMHVENPAELSKTHRVAAYYLMACTFYTVIWSARLSILFSIIRIDPDPVWRKRLQWVAGAFVGAIFFFFAQLMWVCEPEPSWKDHPSPQCELNKQVAICQLISDVLADLLLILLPLRLIHGIKDRALRRRLMVIFSTSIVTTIVSLVHASYIIVGGGIKVVISALVEDCMSLTVANIPVTVTAVMRAMRLGSLGGDSDTMDDSADGPRFSSFRFKSRITGAFATTGFGRTTGGVSVTTRNGPAFGSESVASTELTSKAPFSPTDSIDDRSMHKGSRYISVGTLQGESQWEPEPRSPDDDADFGTASRYISIGSVQQQQTIHETADIADALGRPRGKPMVKIALGEQRVR
ncbi:hypothetical protein EWM64_g6399 [Hericium alpestre]|uniref:Rhodopsin domain-containing protein n=1 Tax=Hericium alpestre TaxID=135208 RepID=A0A4Y9ZUB2_9AGAM|nr:hypothetical protein EWM64_g6399 [Hericium alpestre]